MKHLLFSIYAFLAVLAVTACGGSNDDPIIPAQPTTANNNQSSVETLNSSKTSQCGLTISNGANVLADICQIGTKAADCSTSNIEITNQAALVTGQLGVSTTYSFTPSCGDTLSITSVSSASDALITTLRGANPSGTSAIPTNSLLPLNPDSTPLTLSNTANIGTIVLGGSGNLSTHVTGTGGAVSTTVSTTSGGTLINTGSTISVGSISNTNSASVQITGVLNLSGTPAISANNLLPFNVGSTTLTASNTVNIGTIVPRTAGNLNIRATETGGAVLTTVNTVPSGTLVSSGGTISVRSINNGNSGVLSLSSAAICGIDLSAGSNVLANVCQIGTKAANCTASNTELTAQAAQVTNRLGVSVTYAFSTACGQAVSVGGLSAASDALITTIRAAGSASVEISGTLVLTGIIAPSNDRYYSNTATISAVSVDSMFGGDALSGNARSFALNRAEAGPAISDARTGSNSGISGTLVVGNSGTITTSGTGSISPAQLNLSSTVRCGIALTSADNTVLANICYANAPASTCSANNPLFASTLQQVSNLLGQPVTPSATPLCAANPDFSFTLN